MQDQRENGVEWPGPDVTDVEDRRMKPLHDQCPQLVEAGREGGGTFLGASEGMQLCKHLECIPGRHTSDFRPPELQYNSIILFEGTEFVAICSSGRRKLIRKG